MNNSEKKELNTDEMNQVVGGEAQLPSRRKGCQHLKKVRTGKEREDSYFVFWSRHQYEYRCVHCGATFWEYEERD